MHTGIDALEAAVRDMHTRATASFAHHARGCDEVVASLEHARTSVKARAQCVVQQQCLAADDIGQLAAVNLQQLRAWWRCGQWDVFAACVCAFDLDAVALATTQLCCVDTFAASFGAVRVCDVSAARCEIGGIQLYMACDAYDAYAACDCAPPCGGLTTLWVHAKTESDAWCDTLQCEDISLAFCDDAGVALLPPPSNVQILPTTQCGRFCVQFLLRGTRRRDVYVSACVLGTRIGTHVLRHVVTFRRLAQTLMLPARSVFDAAISPDGHRLVLAEFRENQEYNLHDAGDSSAPGLELVQELMLMDGSQGMLFINNDEYLIKLRSQVLLRKFGENAEDTIVTGDGFYGVTLQAVDDAHVASLRFDGAVHVSNRFTGKTTHVRAKVQAVTFIHGGKHMVAAQDGCKGGFVLNLLDAANGTFIRRIVPGWINCSDVLQLECWDERLILLLDKLWFHMWAFCLETGELLFNVKLSAPNIYHGICMTMAANRLLFVHEETTGTRVLVYE